MQDILSALAHLNRPRLLVRAARHGAQSYERDALLPRLLNGAPLPRNGQALMLLSEVEESLNAQRVNDDAAYSLFRHIEVLIAMIGEARLLRHAQRQRDAAAILTT